MYRIKRFSRVDQSNYSVSTISKMAYKVAKPFASNKNNLARNVVKADQTAKNAIYTASTNPGKFASDYVKDTFSHPVSNGLGTASTIIAPGTGSTVTVATRKADSLLSKKFPKLYDKSTKLGNKIAPYAEGFTNNAFNTLKFA